MTGANVVPWSYSSLTAFETCPKRFQLTRLLKKVREPSSEAMTHGNEVHKALELATLGTQPLADKYKKYQPLVQSLRSRPGKRLVEYKFGLTRGFQPTEFFAKDVWVRGVIDYALVQPKVAYVLDHKTGKPKTDHDQLRLFAGVTFANFPYIETVQTGYLWLAYNKMESKAFTKADVPEIWSDFSVRVQRMEHALKTDHFPPKPSGLCKSWCPCPRSLCEFSGRE
jgi:hypothetical protein